MIILEFTASKMRMPVFSGRIKDPKRGICSIEVVRFESGPPGPIMCKRGAFELFLTERKRVGWAKDFYYKSPRRTLRPPSLNIPNHGARVPAREDGRTRGMFHTHSHTFSHMGGVPMEIWANEKE